MIQPWPPHDPDAKKDYWFDISPAIAEQSSPLVSYELAVDNPPDDALTISDDAESAGVVSFWLEGPTEDVTYVVRLRFELANGFRDDMSRTITGVHT